MNRWQLDDPEYQQEKQKYGQPIPSRTYILQLLAVKAQSFSRLCKTLDLDAEEKLGFKTRLNAMLRDGELLQRSDKKFAINRDHQAEPRTSQRNDGRNQNHNQTKARQTSGQTSTKSVGKSAGQFDDKYQGKVHNDNSSPSPASSRNGVWVKGHASCHRDGFGFVLVEDGEDVYLDIEQMRTVMANDTLEVFAKTGRGGRLYADRVNVLSRASEKLLGQVVDFVESRSASRKKSAQLINDNATNMSVFVSAQFPLLQVSNPEALPVTLDDVVELKIYQYPERLKSGQITPIKAQLVKVLGQVGEVETEINRIITEHDLPHDFANTLLADVATLPDSLADSDLSGREDLRHLPFVTIDGADSRDFDDAVLAKKTASGFKLYVAIADVAHYVMQDSELDREAYLRGTSVYFPDRVIPMLPEKLSNGLCSLNPKVDRLTLVCEMLVSANGEVSRARFYNAVIHSHARLTYDWVQQALFDEDASAQAQHPAILPTLNALKSAYLALRSARDARGTLDFITSEPRFVFTDSGEISEIGLRQTNTANQLIEECMVSANVCAASFLLKHKLLAVFRNHEGPKDEKYHNLINALKHAGVLNLLPQSESSESPKKPRRKSAELTPSSESSKSPQSVIDEAPLQPKVLAQFLQQIKDHPQFDYLQTVVLRSMFQALYQVDNQGHFGLSLQRYTHFTSPIRRYPDLLVHRAIKAQLLGDKIADTKETKAVALAAMQERAKHCSVTERRAEEAAKSVTLYYQCLYMQKQLGEVFAAKISGVREFGLFVSLNDTAISGLIHVSQLGQDYFVFDADRDQLIGERSRKTYQVGEPLSVLLSRVDVDGRKMDFLLADQLDADKRHSEQGDRPRHSGQRDSRQQDTDKRRAGNAKTGKKPTSRTPKRRSR